MRLFLLLSFLPLAGCGWSDNLIATAAVGVNVGSVALIQRTPVDAVYSLWTGRDCSAVRLDRGQTYCRPVEPKPAPPVFWTAGRTPQPCPDIQAGWRMGRPD
jgi:hypothetical protein